MTSALQPTDTDVSFRLKAFATNEGRKLRTQLQAARMQAVEAETAEDVNLQTWGNLELLEIISRSVQALKKAELEEQLTMHSLARNGFLQWRPDLKTRLLRDCRMEEWRQKLPSPEDSHRLYKHWLEDRMKWVEAGAPTKPPPKEFREGLEGCASEDKIPVDWDAETVPKPDDCRLVTSLAGTEIEGPLCEDSHGKGSRQIQCFLGEFSFCEAEKLDFERLLEAQSSFKDRYRTVKVGAGLKEEYKRKVERKKGRDKTRTAREAKRKAEEGTVKDKSMAVKENAKT